jgi:F-type H+-transporting ATPase subunit alpha
MDDLPISRVAEFEEKLLLHVRDEHSEVYKELTDKKEMTDAIDAKLKEIIGNFKTKFASAKK